MAGKTLTQKIWLVALHCVTVAFFTFNAFTQNLETLKDTIKRGTTEEKREALYQIRNLATAEAAMLAISALDDPDPIVRATATHSIVFLPANQAAQILLPLLKDKSIFVRKEMAYALGKSGASTAIRPLLEILNRDKELEVKAASAVALGEIGDISAIDFLLGVLRKKPKEAEEFLRRSAARSIGQISQVQQVKANYVVTPESLLPENLDVFVNLKHSNLAEQLAGFRPTVSVLLFVLQNPKEGDDVKREAAFALGAIGDAGAINSLRSGLNAKDYYLVEICRESLTKLH